MSNASVINVVMITDEGYAMPTGVAVFSLKQNRAEDSRYRIYVLCNGMSDISKSRFMSMSEEAFEIILMDVTEDAERYKEVAVLNMHVTATSLFKFDLPNYLPELDKAIYIDGDVLIQHDLRELYDTDISDAYMAVVEDMKAMTRYDPPILEKLKLDYNRYFNNGVMVMNLDRLRRDNMPQKLLDYRINGINYFQDQDTFNAVTAQNVVFLSPMVNYRTTMDVDFTSEDILKYYLFDDVPLDAAERQSKAVVLHLTGPHKPWKYQMMRLTEKYIGYYSASPFGVERLVLDVLPDGGRGLDKNGGTIRSRSIYYNLWHLLNSDVMGVNQTEDRETKITVSLASCPAQINKAAATLTPIMQQTVKPDRIVLCLCGEEFPQKEKELPEELLKLREHGLELLWCDINLRAHNIDTSNKHCVIM